MKSEQGFPRQLWWLLALLTLAWGFNWPMMKLALAEMAPHHFRALCLLTGAAGVFAIARAHGLPLAVPRGAWPRLVVLSLLNFTVWNVCVAYAVPLLSSGRAAILGYTMPLWGVLFSVWILRERLDARRSFGLVLGMAGMLLLLWHELAAVGRSPAGALLMVGAALAWGLGTVLIKRWPIALPASSLTAWQMTVGVIPILAYAVAFEPGSFDLTALSTPALVGVLYNLIVAFVFCQWAWIKIVLLAPASIATLSTLMVPVVGVFSGVIVLGEQPHWQDYIAMILVTAAIGAVLLPARPRTLLAMQPPE